MEYRAWITVPGLAIEREDLWEPFIEQMERDHADLGPTIGWENSAAYIVLSAEAESEGIAAERMFRAVNDTLRARGLGHLYPAHIDVRDAADPATPSPVAA